MGSIGNSKTSYLIISFSLISAFIFSFLFLFCISEDVELDDESSFIGSITYGDVIQSNIDYGVHSLFISNLTQGTTENYAFAESEVYGLSYENNNSSRYSGFEVKDYFFAIGYNFRANDDLILQVPLHNYNYEMGIICSNDYRVFAPWEKAIGTMIFESQQAFKLTLQSNGSSHVFSGSMSDNFDGTLFFEAQSSNETISGTALANPGEIIIMDKGEGQGLLLALKHKDLSDLSVINGNYNLINLLYFTTLTTSVNEGTEPSANTSQYFEGQLEILNGTISIQMEGILNLDAELAQIDGYLFSFQYNTQTVYLHIIPGKILCIAAYPTNPGDLHFFGVGLM